MLDQDTTSLALHGITIVFYLVIALFTFSSAIALYSLVRYGKNRTIVMGATFLYIILTATLFLIARGQLKLIEF